MAGVVQESTMDTDWMSQGKCRAMDPALFFPSDGIGVQAAQRVCAECVVKSPCLEYALVNKIDEGVWGGASERHRKRLLSQHRRHAAGVRQERVRGSTDSWARR
jgi:WhiB family transcriptional regulator, redox-sensing transcriptional regulator